MLTAEEICEAIQFEFEKVHLAPYQCSAHKWTIGTGHVIKPNEQHLKNGITLDQAKALLKADMAWAFGAVDHLVHVPLTPGRKASTASLIFNQGTSMQTLLRLLNAKDYDGAADQFLRFNHADLNGDGKVEANETLAGLTRRRRCERLIFKGSSVAQLVAMKWTPADPKLSA